MPAAPVQSLDAGAPQRAGTRPARRRAAAARGRNALQRRRAAPGRRWAWRDSRSSPPPGRPAGRSGIALAVSAMIGTSPGGPGQRPDPPRRLQPVDLGHLHVHQHHVEAARLPPPPPPRRRSPPPPPRARPRPGRRRQVLVGGMVLGEEHAHRRQPARRGPASAAGVAGATAGAGRARTVKRKVLPMPGTLRDAERRRPSARRAAAQIASPRPVPPARRRQRVVRLHEILEDLLAGAPRRCRCRCPRPRPRACPSRPRAA